MVETFTLSVSHMFERSEVVKVQLQQRQMPEDAFVDEGTLASIDFNRHNLFLSLIPNDS